MRSRTLMLTAAIFVASAALAQAQNATTSQRRIRVQKDASGYVGSAGGVVATPYGTAIDSVEWYRPMRTACSTVDVSAARAVTIKSELYDPSTMISPDSAKVIALCAVPGQIGSGEMNVANGVTQYAIDIIPNHKMTHTKVIVDAHTGAVLSSKQFGGLRGLTGWVRESAEHKENVKKAPNDTLPQY